MLRVPIWQTDPGMRLAIPVLHPGRPDTLLLKRGFELTDESIDRLRDKGIYEVWIEYPGLELLASRVSAVLLRSRGAVAAHMAQLAGHIRDGGRSGVDACGYQEAVRGLTRALADEPRAALYLHALGGGGCELVRNAADVCFLSLLVGLRLDHYLISERPRLSAYRAKDVVNLGVGGLLHDIGMLDLEDDVADRWRETRDEDDPDWQRHVELGFRRVRDGLDPSAASAVLHHHQRFDGGGFPKRRSVDGASGRTGHDIHVFARIVGAADLFDRLRHPTGCVGVRPSLVAHARLFDPALDGALDPVVRAALVEVAPPCPVGAAVRLDDGRHGVVVDASPAEPLCPIVADLDLLLRGASEEEAAVRIDPDGDVRIEQIDGVVVAEDVDALRAGLARDAAERGVVARVSASA